MIYHIVLADQNENTFELQYELYTHRVAKEWARLSTQALARGAWPAGQSFNFEVTQSDLSLILDQMNQLVEVIKGEALIDMDIPHLDFKNLSQDYLNQLHESFHRYEEEVESRNVYRRNCFTPARMSILCYKTQVLGLYTETHYALGKLNTLIHWVENAYKMIGGEHINQFFNFYLHPNCFTDLRPEDYNLCRISFNFGDLMLGYGTTGKNLYHCYIDNDREVVKEGLIRPQRTISTEILALFPLKDATVNFEIEQNERFRAWCEEAQVSRYGYDITAPEHRIGHIPLGRLITPLDLERVKEVFGKFTSVARVYFS